MNKTELVEAIAEGASLTKVSASKALDVFMNTVTEALKNGHKLELTGFGSFSIGHRAARKGRNPQTGAEIDIPASKSIKFKAGKSLKDAVQ